MDFVQTKNVFYCGDYNQLSQGNAWTLNHDDIILYHLLIHDNQTTTKKFLGS